MISPGEQGGLIVERLSLSSILTISGSSPKQERSKGQQYYEWWFFFLEPLWVDNLRSLVGLCGGFRCLPWFGRVTSNQHDAGCLFQQVDIPKLNARDLMNRRSQNLSLRDGHLAIQAIRAFSEGTLDSESSRAARTANSNVAG